MNVMPASSSTPTRRRRARPLDPDVRRQLVEQVFGRKPRLNAKARAYRLSAGMAGVVAVGTELTLIYA